jgi:hypothetical protein
MSRGPGRAQRAIVSTLEANPDGLPERRLRGMHPRQFQRALRSLLTRGIIEQCNNVLRLSVTQSTQDPSKPAANADCVSYNDSMADNTMREALNLRADRALIGELDRVATLLSRDGMRVSRSAVVRAAIIRGLAIVRAEATASNASPAGAA